MMSEFADFYRLIFVTWAGESNLSPAMLHVVAGLGIMIAGRVWFDRSFKSLWLLGLVLLAALAKELGDFLVYGAIKPDSVSDVFYTVCGPLIVFVSCRTGQFLMRQPAELQ